MKLYQLVTIVIFTIFATGCLPPKAEPIPSDNPVPSISITDNDSVTLYGEVTELSVNKAIKKLHDLQTITPENPIYLLIDSPGGDVMAGIKLIDAMNASVRPVYTVAVGRAVSMAAFIHAYGVKRYMTPYSYVMFHLATLTVSADADVDKLANYLKMINHIVYDLNKKVSENTGIEIHELVAKETTEWFILKDEAKETHVITDDAKFNSYPTRADSELIAESKKDTN